MNTQDNKQTNVDFPTSVPFHGGQTIIITQAEPKKNGLGVAGFVLALVSFFFSWVPVFGWMVWTLGIIFSFIGVFKSPRGLAIAGLFISVVGLILLILFATVLVGLFALSS